MKIWDVTMFLKENNIIYHDIAIRKFLVGQIVKKEMLKFFLEGQK